LLDITTATRRETSARLSAAIHRSKALSRDGLLERLFTLAFRGLVYPQIWEDPVVDLAALRIGRCDHVVAIGSGGCNVLSYLTAKPAHVTAVDLNGAHVALIRLKLCALRHLPDHASFFRFFGSADDQDNLAAYARHIQPKLDVTSRKYWDARPAYGRRRIEMFARNVYRYGLLGRCIGAGHLLARSYGYDPRAMLRARSMPEQRAIFERELAPLFDKPFVRWLLNQPFSLYGLGIPPSQYRSLTGTKQNGTKQNGVAPMLRARIERLACDFDLGQNYFASQAFGRRYETRSDPALPPYLDRRNYEAIKAHGDRVSVHHVSMTEYLQQCPDCSVDCLVLLDAQDWMSDAELTALWGEITRVARPGARVIFRTAAERSLLPGRVTGRILSRWSYDADYCHELTRRDRSSIYGGFHLYTLRGEA
jgi:S-adenosylmethionine-diacylglycerol 3-amino-3-carboxypropyl transferase